MKLTMVSHVNSALRFYSMSSSVVRQSDQQGRYSALLGI